MKKGIAKFISGLMSAALAFNFAAPSVLVMASVDDTIASLSETIRTGLKNYDTEINIQKFEIAPDQEGLARMSEVIGYVRKMPDMFCVNFDDQVKIQPVYTDTGDVILGSLKVTYTNTKEEADALLKEVNDKIDDIVKETITPGMTELQKALNIHDYLVLNTVYDTEGTIADRDGGSSAYDILICGNGVCEGYAQAYNMLMEKVGISSIMVTSYEMNHAWNLVNIDNEWYHVDATWDDPVPDAKGRVNHKYFMLSDNEIRTTNEEAGRTYIHDKWDSKGIEATSTKYDHAFWQTVGTEIFTRGDQWYYVNNKGEYSRYTESTGETDNFVSVCEEYWYVWGQYSTYWAGKYVSLIISGDKVIFNSPTTIYRMNLDGSEKEALTYVNPYENNGYIYGLQLDGSKILAVIKQEPSDSGTLVETVDVNFEGAKVSVIDSMAEVISSMPDGSERSFDMRDTESILPAAAIDAMRNRNVKITLDLGEYSWDISGKNVSEEEAKDLNLEIKRDQGVIPEDVISTVSNARSTVVELALEHEGAFGLTANINYALGQKFSDNIAVLYSYNRAEARMDKVDYMMVDSNGNLQIDLDQSVSYAVVLRNLQIPDEPIMQGPEKPPQEEETPAETTAPAVTTISETTMTTPETTTKEAEMTAAVAVTEPAEVPAVTTTPAAKEETETTTSASASETEATLPASVKGDLDGSGTVDLSDLTVLALYLLGETQLTDAQLEIMDVTGDGIVDLTDLATVKQFLAHKIDKF